MSVIMMLIKDVVVIPEGHPVLIWEVVVDGYVHYMMVTIIMP